MSNSVHLAWVKPALRVLCDPGTRSLPRMVPLQVTEVSLGAELAGHLAARLLLSDKVHKIWAVVTAAAVARFQTLFPEFRGASNLHKLSGSIILPTRHALQMHPNLAEFILHIDEFEYKGGAGCNEFAAPTFHAADAEIYQIIQRHRNIDITHIIDRTRLAPAPAAPSSPAPTAAATRPFISSVRAEIDRLHSDPRNHQLELDAFISADQLQQLSDIDMAFQANQAGAKKKAEVGEYDSAYLTASQMAPFSFSQLDSYGTGSQANFSQDLDAPHSQHHFSQHHAPPPAAAAAAAAATANASTTHVFSSTHRFLAQNARAERVSAGAAPKSYSSSNQAFVAAFGGVPHAVQAPTANIEPGAPAETAAAQTSAATPAAAAASSPSPKSVASKASRSRTPTKDAASLSPVHSPAASRSGSALSPSRSPARSVAPSPGRSSLAVASGEDAQPASQQSELSHRNLLPDSLDDFQASPRQLGMEEESYADEERVAQQESHFPFLTQAHSGSLDDDEEGVEPHSPVLTTTPNTAPSRATPKSPSSLIPSTPTPHSSAHPSPQAAQPPSTTYLSSSIEQRQAERRRAVEARLEAEELKARQEEEEKQREREAAQAAATAAAAEAAAKEEEMRLLEEQARQAEAAAAAAAEAEAAQQCASRPRASAPHPPRDSLADAVVMTDEDACRLAAALTESSPKKRSHAEMAVAQPARSARTTTGATAVSAAATRSLVDSLLGPTPPASKRARHSAPIAPGVEEGVLKALEALDAAKGVTARRKSRFQPLPLSFMASSRSVSSSKTPAGPVQAVAAPPAPAAPAAAAITPAVAVARPAAAASASSSRSVALPPFGTPFPITARQVTAAFHYFRSKRASTKTPSVKPFRPAASSNAEMEDEAESKHPYDEDEDAPASQWF